MRELADAAGIGFGSAVSFQLFQDYLWDGQQKSISIFERDFNLAVVHNGLGWSGEPEFFATENKDAVWFVGKQIEALQSVGISDIRGHCLVYPKYSPLWLQDGVRKGEIGRDQLIELMEKSIVNRVGRWRGKITEWVVVNEPYRHWSEDNDFLQTVIGDEYIEIAFQAARAADPKATLIFNDTFNHAGSSGYNSIFNVSNTVNTEQTRRIVDRLQQRGLIDGVGLQMHLDGAYPPDKNDVVKTMQSYGTPVYVTECDVDIRNVPGSQEERFASQARIYADSLDACFQSGVCLSFSLWEFGDKYSWCEDPQYGGVSNADATPYDDDLEPKPAWYALWDVLNGHATAMNKPAAFQ